MFPPVMTSLLFSQEALPRVKIPSEVNTSEI